MTIPVVDLFAGPGGLGEGFASLKRKGKVHPFRLAISIEKDAVAHRTLLLRAIFRQLRGTPAARHYYDFISGRIDESAFFRTPSVASAKQAALEEAHCMELGKADHGTVDKLIEKAIGKAKHWVLIGGPPCQAYSLAGRSRRKNDAEFSSDEKHFLYKEYLRIIREHRPSVFVMENVKGLLSSVHSGRDMFDRICKDLSHPANNLHYEIRSFVKRNEGLGLAPHDFVIQAESFGVPQSRHRVILFGVRKDLSKQNHNLLSPKVRASNVKDVIGKLPKIRSRLSKESDSHKAWVATLRSTKKLLSSLQIDRASDLIKVVEDAVAKADDVSSTGGGYIRSRFRKAKRSALDKWLLDQRIGGVCQHKSRAHMQSDLSRYLFASAYAKVFGTSPRLKNFPRELLPAHRNVKELKNANVPFLDRFRVQIEGQPSTTVVAHIAKDGHYYIHFDPGQCRSLTVREAARLQTFPDNYFFSGNQTQQYGQVGNAVPPYLALQIASVVSRFLA